MKNTFVFAIVPCALTLILSAASAGDLLTAPSVPLGHDSQFRADSEIFRDQIDRFGDPPSPQATARMVEWAKSHPQDPEGLHWAGRAILKGWTHDEKVDGVSLIKKAATLGYPPAITELGILLDRGIGVAKDEKAADKLFREAAAKGDARAMSCVGANLANEPPNETNWDEAQRDFQSAWDGGYLCAGAMQAQVYAARNHADESLVWWERAADAGDATAMVALAKHYITSNPSELQKARSLYQCAAAWDDPEVLRTLALEMEYRVLDFPDDPAFSACLLVRAAHRGDTNAQAQLADARLGERKNLSIWPDPQRGLRELNWLASGHDDSGAAEYLLGSALLEGTVVIKDVPRAVRMIYAAVGRGNPAAMALWAKLSDAERALLPHVPPGGQDPEPQAPSPAQLAAHDNDDFCDWWYWRYDVPEKEAVARTVERARHDAMKDARALTWASIAVFEGLTQDATATEAIEWLKQAATMGDPIAMAVYGNDLINGGHVRSDIPAGLALLNNAIGKGEPMAYGFLGQAYAHGASGLAPDTDKAIALLKKGIEKGTNRLSYNLFEVYDGLGNYEQAIAYLKEADDNGDLRAVDHVARLQRLPRLTNLHSRNGPYEFPHGWRGSLYRGALLGAPLSMMLTGAKAEDSDKPDPALSRLLLRRAAALGNTQAQAMLAAAHVSGLYGIEIDSERGISELTLLAPAGHVNNGNWGQIEAQWQLGRLLREGHLLETRSGPWAPLIQMAADANHPFAKAWVESQKGDLKASKKIPLETTKPSPANNYFTGP